MKTFELHRDEDETGVSGTGVVAEGCVFSDGCATPYASEGFGGPGWCAMRWKNEPKTTTLFPSLSVVEIIHGHGGKTRIVWLGQEEPR